MWIIQRKEVSDEWQESVQQLENRFWSTGECASEIVTRNL
jgi:hypothetical protein